MKPENKYPIFSGESIRLVSYCPLCNAQYNPLSAKILEERDDAHLIHIQCRKCGSSIVALVLASGVGISSVGLITDLSGDDALRFKNNPTISSDDVLQLYDFLQKDFDIIKHLSLNIS
ncbi:MAG: hypothetical protein PHH01_03630 [Patescibacteria group bacterium]|nr:hypothetical protein [Patescibacteria group bacterium]